MALLSICSWHKWSDIIGLPSQASVCQSKSWLMAVIDQSVGDVWREWDAGLIRVRLSKQTSDWQAIQLSGSEKERNTIITSIISHFHTFCCQTLSLLIRWALYFYCYSLICYDGPAPTWKTNPLWQISKEQRLRLNNHGAVRRCQSCETNIAVGPYDACVQ